MEHFNHLIMAADIFILVLRKLFIEMVRGEKKKDIFLNLRSSNSEHIIYL